VIVMSEPLNICLDGLESKWLKRGQVCAICGKDWDAALDEQAEVEEEDFSGQQNFPLLLFRGKGKKTQLLCLCWKPCAESRLYSKEKRLN